jgi:hypothetical protein
VTTATVAATATTVAAILGIHAGETTDVIRHQDRRCRQDSANCQSQQTFLEKHDEPPLGIA